MIWRMVKAVLILPGTVLIYVPLLIQWLIDGWPFSPMEVGAARWVIAAILAIPAFALAARTMSLFVHNGEGTPAPWDPPKKFVVTGPYRHVRNPMLSAVILLIIAEAVALNSLALGVWAVAFFLLNTVYFIRREEPELEQRFGDDYRRYKANVPRWIPRLRPYRA